MDSIFLSACHGKATQRPPLWLMRQAGRYLPEYRDVRRHVTFLELCKTPRLAAQVTLQPIRRFGFDAAILFSDLLIPLEAMGLEVAFTEQGPMLPMPVRSADDVARVHVFDPWESTPFVYETIRLLRDSLADTPLIGFAGAPFTTATYAIEGKTGKHFTETKKLFHRDPEAAHRLLATIEAATRGYLLAQVAAGAQAIQIFDSWVGVVSPEEWDEFVCGPTKALIAAVKATGVPVIYFPNGATTLLERIAQVEADVYSIDWRLPLAKARERLRAGGAEEVVLQGNLDPALLLGSPERLQRQVAEILRQTEGHPHVFNLGHGILPETPIENVEVLVRSVRGG
jgi:uroporphyrinogen decarboxylase